MKAKYFIVTALFFATKACSSDDAIDHTATGGAAAQGGQSFGGSPISAGEGGAAGAPTQDPPTAGMANEGGTGGAQAGAPSLAAGVGGAGGVSSAGGAAGMGGVGGGEDAGAGGAPVVCPTSVRYEFIAVEPIGTCTGTDCVIDNDRVVSFCKDPQGRREYGCEISLKTLSATMVLDTTAGTAVVDVHSTYEATSTALLCDARASIQEPATHWEFSLVKDGTDSNGCATYKWMRDSFTAGKNIPTTMPVLHPRVGLPIPTCSSDLSPPSVYDGFAVTSMEIQPIKN